ncbi:unnamed protein product, partial [Polarella glacialis]
RQMQAPGVENMWNRYADWQEPWKDGRQGQDPWKDTRPSNRGWFEHPSDTEITPQYDAYGNWQPQGAPTNGYGDGGWAPDHRRDQGNGQQMPNSNGNSHSGMGASVAQLFAAAEAAEANGSHEGSHMSTNHQQMGGGGGNPWSPGFDAGRDRPREDHGHGMQQHHGSHSYGNQHQHMDHQPFGAPSAQNHNGQNHNGQNHNGHYSSPATNGHSAAAHSARGVGANTEHDEDNRQMLADLEESMRNIQIERHQSSDSEDDGPKQPAEATAEERLEAENIVRTAFKEAKERDRLREKVRKGVSPADLQALLNARIAKR